MAHYRFIHSWVLETDVETVWRLVENVENADWWGNCNFQKIKQGPGPGGVGDVYLSVFRTKLPYKLSFQSTITRKVKPRVLELKAEGELEGKGICTFRQVGPFTEIRFSWEVYTRKRWMNMWAPLFRKAFIWNHDRVMNEGAREMSRHLGIRLVYAGS